MTLWLVRAGKYGENDTMLLKKYRNDWLNEIPDISTITSKKDLEGLYLRTNPNVQKMSTQPIIYTKYILMVFLPTSV